MRNFYLLLAITLILSSCSSQKKLAYLNNLPEAGGQETFTMVVPEYRLQIRDILYITIKAMLPDGNINDFLATSKEYSGNSITQGDAGGFVYGYDIKPNGNLILPAVGPIKVEGLTLEETRKLIQVKADSIYKNSIVECKLLSFKFTVIGEVRAPGTYINYNNYLTVMEAIGRAGSIDDYGNRKKVLVVRTVNNSTKTYTLNLQDKSLLSSQAYFLLPNDVVIVEPLKQKVFNLNLPTISFILSSALSTITTSLLLINYFKK